jgi:hypothetical protein
MKKMVKQIVNGCDICKQAKLERIIYPGLLQPPPVPNGVWKDITMDFIEGSFRSEGKDIILVIVDKLTKYNHFIALSHPFTAKSVVEIFLNHFL